MNDHLINLVKLQALEFSETSVKNAEAQMADLRARIPQQVLAHYDRLATRGKKGVALIRNQVCSGCNMRLPIGTINTLMHGHDVQLCDTCGRYLYLPDLAAEPLPPPPPPPPAPAPKRRKRKNLASAVA